MGMRIPHRISLFSCAFSAGLFWIPIKIFLPNCGISGGGVGRKSHLPQSSIIESIDHIFSLACVCSLPAPGNATLQHSMNLRKHPNQQMNNLPTDDLMQTCSARCAFLANQDSLNGKLLWERDPAKRYFHRDRKLIACNWTRNALPKTITDQNREHLNMQWLTCGHAPQTELPWNGLLANDAWCTPNNTSYNDWLQGVLHERGYSSVEKAQFG